jgi:hypothetical protein
MACVAAVFALVEDLMLRPQPGEAAVTSASNCQKEVIFPFPLISLEVTSDLVGAMVWFIAGFGARLLCIGKGRNEGRWVLGKSRIEEAVEDRCLKQKSCRMTHKVFA